MALLKSFPNFSCLIALATLVSISGLGCGGSLIGKVTTLRTSDIAAAEGTADPERAAEGTASSTGKASEASPASSARERVSMNRISNQETKLRTNPSPPSSEDVALGFFDPGAIAIHENRLIFSAYVPDLPRNAAAPTVELLRDGQSIAVVPFRKTNYGYECRQVVATDNGRVNYYDDCSFNAPTSVGNYQLQLKHAGRLLATLPVNVVKSHRMNGTAHLMVSPGQRDGTVTSNSAVGYYWHRMDLRHQAAFFKFVWMRGNEVIATHNGAVSGNRLWDRQSPLVSVTPVKFFALNKQRGKSYDDVRLLVFGNKFLGAYATQHVAGGTEIMTPMEASAEQIAAASEAAKHKQRDSLRVQGQGVAWTEAEVCAAFHDEDAFTAVADWGSNANARGFATLDIRDHERQSKNPLLTREERARHRTLARASQKGKGKAGRDAQESSKAVTRFARRYKKGCLSKIAPM